MKYQTENNPKTTATIPNEATNFVNGKKSTSTDTEWFPSLNGLDIEQNKEKMKTFPQIY